MPIKLNDFIYCLGADLDVIILEKETEKILYGGNMIPLAVGIEGDKFRAKYGDYNLEWICKEKYGGVYYAQDLIIVVEKGE